MLHSRPRTYYSRHRWRVVLFRRRLPSILTPQPLAPPTLLAQLFCVLDVRDRPCSSLSAPPAPGDAFGLRRVLADGGVPLPPRPDATPCVDTRRVLPVRLSLAAHGGRFHDVAL